MVERKAFLLRVDPRIHDAMRHWAEDEFRSLNAQVEVILLQSLIGKGRLSNEPIQEDESDLGEPGRDKD